MRRSGGTSGRARLPHPLVRLGEREQPHRLLRQRVHEPGDPPGGAGGNASRIMSSRPANTARRSPRSSAHRRHAPHVAARFLHRVEILVSVRKLGELRRGDVRSIRERIVVQHARERRRADDRAVVRARLAPIRVVDVCRHRHEPVASHALASRAIATHPGSPARRFRDDRRATLRPLATGSQDSTFSANVSVAASPSDPMGQRVASVVDQPRDVAGQRVMIDREIGPERRGYRGEHAVPIASDSSDTSLHQGVNAAAPGPANGIQYVIVVRAQERPPGRGPAQTLPSGEPRFLHIVSRQQPHNRHASRSPIHLGCHRSGARRRRHRSARRRGADGARRRVRRRRSWRASTAWASDSRGRRARPRCAIRPTTASPSAPITSCRSSTRGWRSSRRRAAAFRRTGRVLYGPVEHQQRVQGLRRPLRGAQQRRRRRALRPARRPLADRDADLPARCRRGATTSRREWPASRRDVSPPGVARAARARPCARTQPPPPPPPRRARPARRRARHRRRRRPQPAQGSYAMCYAVSTGADPLGSVLSLRVRAAALPRLSAPGGLARRLLRADQHRRRR